MSAYVKARRDKWIKENGPCVKCGSTENLQVDHIDKNTKIIHTSHIWTRSKATRIEELAKCQVLCSNCHAIKTKKENTTIKHGTLNAYQRHKCRCNVCKSFYTNYRRSIYLKTK